MSEQVVYTARVRIERVKGPHQRAHLPAAADPIHFGVHSEVAAHYNISPDASEPGRPRSITPSRPPAVD